MTRNGAFCRPLQPCSTRAEILRINFDQFAYKAGGAGYRTRLLVRWHFTAADGSSTWSDALGIGMDQGDKDGNKAMSVAHKYSLLQVFMIATKDDKDPENEEHETKAPGGGQQRKPAAAQKPAPAQAPAPVVGNAAADFDASAKLTKTLLEAVNMAETGPSMAALWKTVRENEAKLTPADVEILRVACNQRRKYINDKNAAELEAAHQGEAS